MLLSMPFIAPLSITLLCCNSWAAVLSVVCKWKMPMAFCFLLPLDLPFIDYLPRAIHAKGQPDSSLSICCPISRSAAPVELPDGPDARHSPALAIAEAMVAASSAKFPSEHRPFHAGSCRMTGLIWFWGNRTVHEIQCLC